MYFQDLHFGDCPGVNDAWIDVISSQGSSVLSVDLSGSEVTDDGLMHLRNCSNLQSLNLNFCEHISDRGLAQIGGMYPIIFNLILLLMQLKGGLL